MLFLFVLHFHALNRFYTLLWYFLCQLWTCKFQLGCLCSRQILARRQKYNQWANTMLNTFNWPYFLSLLLILITFSTTLSTFSILTVTMMSLTSGQCSLSITPDNIRKTVVFWCFQGVWKVYIGLKWVKYVFDCWVVPFISACL